jgi:hypothetical protein
MRGRGVEPIEAPRSQFEHTSKHLYDAAECWNMAISGLPDCRSEALEAGCTKRDLERSNQHRYDRACESCRSQVLYHHDRYYAPAYLQAVKDPHITAELAEKRTGYVGCNGVLTLVGPRRIVISAWRCTPHGRGSFDEQDFLEAAVDGLKDRAMRAIKGKESGMSARRNWEEMLAGELGRLWHEPEQERPRPARIHRLLVMLGRAHQLPQPGDTLATLLDEARREELAPRLRVLIELPGPDELVSTLARDLGDDEDLWGPLFDSLMAIDDAITIQELLGEHEFAGRLARRAAGLVLAHTARTRPFADWAKRRLDTLPPGSMATIPWQAVIQDEESVPGRLLRRMVSLLEYAPLTAALHPALAATLEEVQPLEGDRYAVYRRDGQLMLQVLLAEDERLRGQPNLWLCNANSTLAVPLEIEHEHPGSVWLRLGTDEEMAAKLAPWRSQAAGEPESIFLELVLDRDSET